MAERAGYFVSTDDQPRVRRAADAARLGFGLVLLLLTALNATRLGSLEAAMVSVVDSLPGWTGSIFWVGYAGAAVYAFGMLLVSIGRFRKNPSAAIDVILAAVTAVAIATLGMRSREGVWPSLLPEFGAATPQPFFPVVRVALVTAIVVALSPHVTRSLRRLGGVMILLVAISGLGAGFGYPTDVLGAIGIGLVAGGGVLLVFGSPTGYPDVRVVATALAELGVAVDDLSLAPDQSWGTRRLIGLDPQDVPVEVKAYGRDASDSQLAAKAWRALWYRDSGPTLSYSRMQAVEHEALVMMFASRAGVPTAEPLAAAMAGDDVALLAARLPGEPLSMVPPSAIADDMLANVWAGVSDLHAADMSHGSLTAESVILNDGSYLLHNFERGSLAAGDRRHVDVVQFLFSLAGIVGAARAVDAARRGLGPDALAAALPYFQLPALSLESRRAVDDKSKSVIKDLRSQVEELTGVDAPEPAKLRRVSLSSLLMPALTLFAAYALIGQLAGIDFESVWQVVRNASWLVLIFAFIATQASFIGEGFSMIAAVGKPIPLRPIVVLQVAARFIGLAVPSAAGRIAMNSAFLVKFGVGPPVAVVAGAIDGLSGFMVEASILALALIFSDARPDLGSGTVNFQRILVILAVIAAVSVIVLLSVKKVRNRVVPVIVEALSAVADVAKDPRRILTLVVSNFLVRLALAMALWMVLRALGSSVSIPVALAVVVATNLLAGLVPVPGGIGVAEATMSSLLVLAGVDQSTAFAATVVFRMFSFYIPALQGFPAMKWLERNDYL